MAVHFFDDPDFDVAPRTALGRAALGTSDVGPILEVLTPIADGDAAGCTPPGAPRPTGCAARPWPRWRPDTTRPRPPCSCRRLSSTTKRSPSSTACPTPPSGSPPWPTGRPGTTSSPARVGGIWPCRFRTRAKPCRATCCDGRRRRGPSCSGRSSICWWTLRTSTRPRCSVRNQPGRLLGSTRPWRPGPAEPVQDPRQDLRRRHTGRWVRRGAALHPRWCHRLDHHAAAGTDPEDDQFFPGQPQELHDRLPAAKEITRFTRERCAKVHCQPLALGLTGQVMGDFLADQLARVRDGGTATAGSAPAPVTGRA
jgi:hypothetical protein